MSLPTQTLKRIPQIKKGLLTGLNYQQIGDSVGVTEKTIDRDVKQWLNSGDFETWVKEEWVRLHTQIIHDNPTEAYKQISRIVGRMVTRKLEAHSIDERRETHVFISAKLMKDEPTANSNNKLRATQQTV